MKKRVLLMTILLLLATGSAQAEKGAFIEAGALPVTWTNAVGVAEFGNNLSRTASGQGWGNSGASSTQSISGDGYMTFQCPSGINLVLAGLSNEDLDQHYTSIQFGLYCYYDNIRIFESGTQYHDTPYVPSDVFSIRVENNVVTYYKNEELIYTSALTPTLPLVVDTVLGIENGVINNVTLSNYPYGNPTVAYYNNGKVGIGTTAPSEALEVTGNIKAGGYVQLGLTVGEPPITDCDDPTEYGRMKVDSAAGDLYICIGSGWARQDR